MEEVWKDLRDFGGLYQISNLGRVKSLDRRAKKRDGSTQFVKGRILKTSETTQGYKKLGLYNKGKSKTVYVARLVALNFIPNPDNKPEVNHINGIKSDNRVKNLEWVTPSENIRHSFSSGFSVVPKGESHGASKLTTREILEMRKLYKTKKYTYKDLAEVYNVAKITVSRIITKESWNHI